jgi:hypothetical protein
VIDFVTSQQKKFIIKMFPSPFSVGLRPHQQTYNWLHGLKSDSKLNEKCHDSLLTNFYSKQVSCSKIPDIRKLPMLMPSVFEGTYHLL